VVNNVRYDADSVNATHAQLTWDSVDIKVRSIRGFFRGYQVLLYTVSRKITIPIIFSNDSEKSDPVVYQFFCLYQLVVVVVVVVAVEMSII